MLEVCDAILGNDNALDGKAGPGTDSSACLHAEVGHESQVLFHAAFVDGMPLVLVLPSF